MKLNKIVKKIHQASVDKGWWTVPTMNGDWDMKFFINKDDSEIHDPVLLRLKHALVVERLGLIHSELSEALEGYRKNAQDDKLPQYKAFDVELTDALIRILETGGAFGIDFEELIKAKMAYNATREDHKVENRSKSNGKRF
jgi:hypothetical protein